jgi:ADP-ribose pyrophosphatase
VNDASSRRPDLRVELLERTTAYDGYFKIIRYRLRHRLFSGGMGPDLTREVFERGQAAAVLPYDPVRDQVVLVEQFRVGAYAAGDDEPWLIEPVAGIIEPDERPGDVAAREAKEEAGLVVTDLIPACEYFVSPGGATEICKVFIGRVDATGAGGVHGLADEGEDIRVHVVTLDEALAWHAEGRLRVASTLVAVQWLALHRGEVRSRWLGEASGS